MLTVEQITRWVEEGNEHLFYISYPWKKTSREVRKEYRNECQDCKEKHKRFRKATMVHHEIPLRTRPDLALCRCYVDAAGVKHRQLTPLCDECHDMRHPENLRQFKPKEQITKERWD